MSTRVIVYESIAIFSLCNEINFEIIFLPIMSLHSNNNNSFTLTCLISLTKQEMGIKLLIIIIITQDSIFLLFVECD